MGKVSQSQVRTNTEKYNFTAEKAHFAKSSRQGLENLRSDLPRLEFHADHDAVRIINNGQITVIFFPVLLLSFNSKGTWCRNFAIQ